MDKTDIIDFTELPKEVLDQIPYSIKTKKTKYVVNELPLEIQYLLDKYFIIKCLSSIIVPSNSAISLKCS